MVHMDKFEWLASNSAPAGAPMSIRAGAFFYAGGGSLYIPPATLHEGWGTAGSIHLVGEDTKPLPDRVEVTFMSYLENRLYSGSFPLPHAQIVTLFQEGYRSFLGDSDWQTYNKIVVGVAPGGVVAVWVSGVERQVEVFFGQAKEVDGDWHSIMGFPNHVQRAQFVAESLADAATVDPLVRLMIEQTPIGAWALYRRLYNWRPVFEGMAVPDRLRRIRFFNGERDYVLLSQQGLSEPVARPVPSSISFVEPSTRWAYEITFEEQETISAFERLGTDGQPLELAFVTIEDGIRSTFDIVLRNKEEAVTLRKVQREFRRAD
jgi:hypothetical protein